FSVGWENDTVFFQRSESPKGIVEFANSHDFFVLDHYGPARPQTPVSFERSTTISSRGYSGELIQVRDYLAALPFFLCSLAWLIATARRTRFPIGCCMRCGYDL